MTWAQSARMQTKPQMPAKLCSVYQKASRNLRPRGVRSSCKTSQGKKTMRGKKQLSTAVHRTSPQEILRMATMAMPVP